MLYLTERERSCLSDQRYNFLKANHNLLLLYFSIFRLFIRSKIQFFESKSQPIGFCWLPVLGCLSDQRYNFLKANHNPLLCGLRLCCVVYQIKDTIFWKQITTLFWHNIWFLCCLSDQRYNFLKANHNRIPIVEWDVSVVYQIKDTIFWKQITTVNINGHVTSGCLSDQRYNFLKANHNYTEGSSLQFRVVYQVKDTIFWKQITTYMLSVSKLESCLSDQRYIPIFIGIESKSRKKSEV